MLNELAGKKQCANFKKGKCVSLINPQPLDNFKIFNTRVGSNQRCNACLEFYKKKYYCINFKHNQCFSSVNPQFVDQFVPGVNGSTKNKKCKTCEESDKKFCSNYKKGTCTVSSNPQVLSNFMPHRGKQHGYSQCTSCVNKYYQDNKIHLRARIKKWAKESGFNTLRKEKLYGLEPGQYNKIFEEQAGCCAICHMHQSDSKRTLSIDHCHSTGKVRGLLCDSCNQALGFFDDNPEIMLSAVDYLKRTS